MLGGPWVWRAIPGDRVARPIGWVGGSGGRGRCSRGRGIGWSARRFVCDGCDRRWWWQRESSPPRRWRWWSSLSASWSTTCDSAAAPASHAPGGLAVPLIEPRSQFCDRSSAGDPSHDTPIAETIDLTAEATASGGRQDSLWSPTGSGWAFAPTSRRSWSGSISSCHLGGSPPIRRSSNGCTRS
jgi:hypothetical protein